MGEFPGPINRDGDPIDEGDVWEIPNGTLRVMTNGVWVTTEEDRHLNRRMTKPPPEDVKALERWNELEKLREAGVIL